MQAVWVEPGSGGCGLIGTHFVVVVFVIGGGIGCSCKVMVVVSPTNVSSLISPILFSNLQDDRTYGMRFSLRQDSYS
jgi:hypothetical protein